MPSDGVMGQRRRIFVEVPDLTVREKSRFYECLEPVADSQDHSVAFQQFMDRVFHFFVLQHIYNEFRRTVGLITR